MYVGVELGKYFLLCLFILPICQLDKRMTEDLIVYVQKRKERERETSHVFCYVEDRCQ